MVKAILIATVTFLLCIDYVLSIVNGTTVEDIKQFPYQASIRYERNDHPAGNGYICSGVLIDWKHVLTSAQCLYSTSGQLYRPTELSVIFGTIDRILNSNSSKFIARSVETIFLHDNFNATQKRNDIAVLRLHISVPDNMTEIKLVNIRNDTVRGQTPDCRLTGWGLTNEIVAEFPKTLQATNLTIYGKSSCTNLLGRELDDDHLCAGFAKRGACIVSQKKFLMKHSTKYLVSLTTYLSLG